MPTTTLDVPPVVEVDEDEDETASCDNCGNEFPADECCEDCTSCGSCGSLVSNEDLLARPSGRYDYLCNDCWHVWFFTCHQCGWEGSIDYRCYDEDSGNDYCDECLPEAPSRPAEDRRYCHTCNAYADLLNPTTERFECAHERAQRTARFLERLKVLVHEAEGRLPLTTRSAA